MRNRLYRMTQTLLARIFWVISLSQGILEKRHISPKTERLSMLSFSELRGARKSLSWVNSGCCRLFLRLENLGCGSEVNFTGIHQCFTERWVRMNTVGDVMDFTTHFDC